MRCAMSKSATGIAVLMSLLFAANSAYACDLCAIYRGVEAKESRPGVSVGLAEQFTRFSTLKEDGREVQNEAGQYMESFITQFFAGYRFSPDAGVQVNVPLVSRSFRRPEGFAIDRGVDTGLGDISVIFDYRLIDGLTEDTFYILSVFGGVKLPTGDSGRLQEEKFEPPAPPGAPESGIHGHDLALGSGSTDVIAGLSGAFHYNRFFVDASAQYAIRTRGALGYRYANDLIWAVKPGYFPLVEHDKTFGIQLAVTGEAKGRDTFMDKKAEDTGVNSVFMGPELSFTWKDTVSASIGVDIPVMVDNTALQVTPDFKVRGGLVWRM